MFQGVARKAVADTAYSEPSIATSAGKGGGADERTTGPGAVPSLQEILNKKTGYEADAEEGAHLDGDDLAAELDNLDFDDDDHSGSNDPLEDEDDDDIDLR